MQQRLTGPRVKEVEEEYGQDFWEVVKSYADDGESIHATGKILGYKGGSFHRLVLKHKKEHWFRPMVETNGFKAAQSDMTDAKKAALAKAQAAAHKMNPTYRWIELDGLTMTLSGHAKRRGILRSLVYTRLNKGLSIEDAFKPSGHFRKNGQWSK